MESPIPLWAEQGLVPRKFRQRQSTAVTDRGALGRHGSFRSLRNMVIILFSLLTWAQPPLTPASGSERSCCVGGISYTHRNPSRVNERNPAHAQAYRPLVSFSPWVRAWTLVSQRQHHTDRTCR